MGRGSYAPIEGVGRYPYVLIVGEVGIGRKKAKKNL
jgi:hypothetical protein